MLFCHAEGHLLAELIFSGGREEQGFILTGADCLEVGYLSPHHGVQSVCVCVGGGGGGGGRGEGGRGKEEKKEGREGGGRRKGGKGR